MRTSCPFINGGEHIEWAPEIPIWFSLAAIVLILGVTTVLSLLKARSMTPEELDHATGPRAPHHRHRDKPADAHPDD